MYSISDICPKLCCYITILCKTTCGNSVHVPSGRMFWHSAPCLWHLQASIYGKLIFLQLQSLLRHPMYQYIWMRWPSSHMTWSLSMLLEWVVEREVAVLTTHSYDPNPYLLQWEERGLVSRYLLCNGFVWCEIVLHPMLEVELLVLVLYRTVQLVPRHTCLLRVLHIADRWISLPTSFNQNESTVNPEQTSVGLSTHYIGSCTPHWYAEHCRQASAAHSSINGTGTCSSNSGRGSIS